MVNLPALLASIIVHYKIHGSPTRWSTLPRESTTQGPPDLGSSNTLGPCAHQLSLPQPCPITQHSPQHLQILILAATGPKCCISSRSSKLNKPPRPGGLCVLQRPFSAHLLFLCYVIYFQKERAFLCCPPKTLQCFLPSALPAIYLPPVVQSFHGQGLGICSFFSIIQLFQSI